MQSPRWESSLTVEMIMMEKLLIDSVFIFVG